VIWAAIASAIAVAVAASSKRSRSLLLQWLDEWRRDLRRHVDDDERRAAATAIINAEAEQLEPYFEDVDASLRAAYEVHRDYDSTLERLTPFIDEITTAFAEIQRSHVRAAFEMEATLTPDEWSSIQDEVGERLDRYWAKRRRRDRQEPGATTR
jgi:hypothetical protein